MGYKKQVFRSLAMVTQLGISVMTPIFLCMSAGCWVDNHFGTKTTLFFLFLGVLTGGRCGYHMAKITFLAGEKEDRKEREQQILNQKEPKYEMVSRPKPTSRVKGVGAGKEAAQAEPCAKIINMAAQAEDDSAMTLQGKDEDGGKP